MKVDVSKLSPGELKVVDWDGRPVWILRRTQEHLEAVRKANGKVTDPRSEAPMQPEYARNEYRSIKPEVLVLVGICTHRGCTPQAEGDGFLCPCHGSKFDLAGRVYKGSPAPVNLEVPPHRYASDSTILIGTDDDPG